MRQPRIDIVYCTQCRWLLRATWMAQELLTTFEDELGEVALAPGKGECSRSELTKTCYGRGGSRAAFRRSRNSSNWSGTRLPQERISDTQTDE